MRIECTSGPVTTEVMGTVYRFDPDEDGRFIAEVFNPKHQVVFLAVTDHYRDVDAPEPELSLAAIDPTTAEVGAADLTLTVTGTGFGPDSVIVFNGGEEETTIVSDTQLTTIVKPSTASGAVAVPVWVRSGGEDSASIDFTFTEAGGPAAAIPVTEITGIGPAMQTRLAEAGITDARQIAALTEEEATALDEQLGLGGRIARDGWVEQAKALTG